MVKRTRQEVADFFGVYVTTDENGKLSNWWARQPRYSYDAGIWPPTEDSWGNLPPLNDEGVRGENAIACPKWIPQKGEPVACFDNGENLYVVCPFNLNSEGDDVRTSLMWDNICHYSGQLDMRVEALKDEPFYKGGLKWKY